MAVLLPVMLAVTTAEPAAGAIVAVLAGFGARLLLDFGLFNLVTNQGRR